LSYWSMASMLIPSVYKKARFGKKRSDIIPVLHLAMKTWKLDSFKCGNLLLNRLSINPIRHGIGNW
jgi:hypothetical protein